VCDRLQRRQRSRAGVRHPRRHEQDDRIRALGEREHLGLPVGRGADHEYEVVTRRESPDDRPVSVRCERERGLTGRGSASDDHESCRPVTVPGARVDQRLGWLVPVLIAVLEQVAEPACVVAACLPRLAVVVGLDDDGLDARARDVVGEFERDRPERLGRDVPDQQHDAPVLLEEPPEPSSEDADALFPPVGQGLRRRQERAVSQQPRERERRVHEIGRLEKLGEVVGPRPRAPRVAKQQRTDDAEEESDVHAHDEVADRSRAHLALGNRRPEGLESQGRRGFARPRSGTRAQLRDASCRRPHHGADEGGGVELRRSDAVDLEEAGVAWDAYGDPRAEIIRGDLVKAGPLTLSEVHRPRFDEDAVAAEQACDGRRKPGQLVGGGRVERAEDDRRASAVGRVLKAGVDERETRPEHRETGRDPGSPHDETYVVREREREVPVCPVLRLAAVVHHGAMLRSVEGLARRRSRRFWLVAASLWAALIFISSSIPSGGTTGGVEPKGALLHLAEFAILASLLRAARLPWTTTFAAAALYGVTDEFHQALVPGRDASPIDLIFDAAGAAIGALVVGPGRIR
jgi:VanZ like protein